ncbi:hypothetical protein VMUT_0717 [Vulcanisaeta moutnovskia 768-28]|uniref:MOFRL-associated domain-containing protein n=1 Tax=Vulcanisaeta moutnovskia (strain 768-28) TaxID=985053 RepID=F0QW04_VULM7|nr:hypothetical protein VMUT_0717 [Vulcanisaeta moutnovskia 768-28]
MRYLLRVWVLRTVASGPTVSDPTTYKDATTILRNRGLWDNSSP